ncbi:MAG: hypothetical protein MUC57_13070, partial [Desulfobacterales bacterium]|nr:hypothetical protein [Desulfobacterales bacterium]
LNTGTQRAAAVEDFSLREIERVLALNASRRNIVADTVADDFTPRVDNQCQFRLGHVPRAVSSNEDSAAVSNRSPSAGLKKKLRPFVSAAMQSLITPYKPRALHMVADPTLTAQRAIVLSVNG